MTDHLRCGVYSCCLQYAMTDDALSRNSASSKHAAMTHLRSARSGSHRAGVRGLEIYYVCEEHHPESVEQDLRSMRQFPLCMYLHFLQPSDASAEAITNVEVFMHACQQLLTDGG